MADYEDKLLYRIVVSQADLDAVTASVASAAARGMGMATGGTPVAPGAPGQPASNVQNVVNQIRQHLRQAKGTPGVGPNVATGGAPGGPAIPAGMPGSPISQKTISNLISPMLRSTFPGIFGYRTIGGHMLTQAQRGAFGVGNVNQHIGGMIRNFFNGNPNLIGPRMAGGNFYSKGIGSGLSGFMQGMGATGGNIRSALLRSGMPGGAILAKAGLPAIAGAATAAVTSLIMLKGAINKATEGFHQIASSLVGGDVSKTIHGMINVMQGAAKGIGGVITGIGAAVMLINPPIGAAIAAFGALTGYVGEKVIGVLHSFVDVMDNMVDQLGQWSPIVAAQQAIFEAKTMMFNIQMAQVFQPMMSAWIQIKSAVLDVLLDFGKSLGPLMGDIGDIMHDLIPIIKSLAEALTGLIADVIALAADLAFLINPSLGTAKAAWHANFGDGGKGWGKWLLNNTVPGLDLGSAVMALGAGRGDNKSGPDIGGHLGPTVKVPIPAGLRKNPLGKNYGFNAKEQAKEDYYKQNFHYEDPSHFAPIGSDKLSADAPSGGDAGGFSPISDIMALFQSPDRDRVSDLLDMETQKVSDEFCGWQHETNRAACLAGMVNPVGIYL